MRPIRVSIAALLAGIALVGVAIAALVHPSPLWGNTLFSLTASVLLLAVLAAIYGRGRKRAFRVGFSTCGWAYFLAVFGPAPISHLEPDLLPAAWLDVLYPYTIPRAATVPPPTTTRPPRVRARGTTDASRIDATVVLAGAFSGGGGGMPYVPPTAWQLWTSPDRDLVFDGHLLRCPTAFQKIGHAIFCLLFAAIGGHLTSRFREARDREGAARAPSTTG